MPVFYFILCVCWSPFYELFLTAEAVAIRGADHDPLISCEQQEWMPKKEQRYVRFWLSVDGISHTLDVFFSRHEGTLGMSNI